MRIIIFSFIAAVIFLLGSARIAADSRKNIELKVAVQDIPADRNQPYIIIDSSDSVSDDANSFDFNLTAYRGSGLKRTIYVWMENSERKRVSSKQKFSLPQRFTVYNLSAELNITDCLTEDSYRIIAEGLGQNITKALSVDLIGCGENDSLTDEVDVIIGDVSFSVLDYNNISVSGEPVSSRILISNPTDKYLEVSAWSYVYRSSVSYSGDRAGNKKQINVPAYANVTFDLENTVKSLPGNYTLKIKLLRSDRKTPFEFNLPLSVTGSNKLDVSNNTLSIANTNYGLSNRTNESAIKKRSLFSVGSSGNATGAIGSGVALFESSSAKAKKLTIYLLLAVLTLILVIIILKKL